MQILMDIDGTIAYRNDAQFVQLLWQAFGLASDACPQTASLTEFLALPKVHATRRRIGENRFHLLVSILQQSETAIVSRLVIPGAYEAVHQLARLGQLRYCTARKASYSGLNGTTAQAIDTLNTHMQRATYDWLVAHNFPCPEQVIFCNGARGKAETLAACIRESGEVMLIDNELDAILATVTQLSQDMQDSIITHGTMVAFGQQEWQSATVKLRCLSLPTWEYLNDVISALSGKDAYAWK